MSLACIEPVHQSGNETKNISYLTSGIIFNKILIDLFNTSPPDCKIYFSALYFLNTM